MLKITIPSNEGFNEQTQEFVTLEKDTTIVLEHSLVSLSKWESKWHKPFLSKNEKTKEELVDYVRCMTITQNVKDEVYYFLTSDNLKDINAYIEDSMTATVFNSRNEQQGASRKTEIWTSEIIYYMMISYQIPIEFEKRHLNKLLALIKVFSVKNNPGKKMSRGDVLRNNHALNEARLRQRGL